jgi:hypothetical protein
MSRLSGHSTARRITTCIAAVSVDLALTHSARSDTLTIDVGETLEVELAFLNPTVGNTFEFGTCFLLLPDPGPCQGTLRSEL